MTTETTVEVKQRCYDLCKKLFAPQWISLVGESGLENLQENWPLAQYKFDLKGLTIQKMQKVAKMLGEINTRCGLRTRNEADPWFRSVLATHGYQLDHAKKTFHYERQPWDNDKMLKVVPFSHYSDRLKEKLCGRQPHDSNDFIQCIYKSGGLRQLVDGYLVYNRAVRLVNFIIQQPNYQRVFEALQYNLRILATAEQRAESRAYVRKLLVRYDAVELCFGRLRLFDCVMVKPEMLVELNNTPAIVFNDWQALFELYYFDKQYNLTTGQMLSRTTRPHFTLFGEYRSSGGSGNTTTTTSNDVQKQEWEAEDKELLAIATRVAYPYSWLIKQQDVVAITV